MSILFQPEEHCYQIEYPLHSPYISTIRGACFKTGAVKDFLRVEMIPLNDTAKLFVNDQGGEWYQGIHHIEHGMNNDNLIVTLFGSSIVKEI